jgi:hypothetical protein
MTESTFVVKAIANYLIEAMKDCANLDGIKMFVRGVAPMTVPVHLYPYSEVIVLEEARPPRDWKSEIGQTYKGQITFYTSTTATSGGDMLEPVVARVKSLPNYDRVGELVYYARQEFDRETHANMGGLTCGGEQVTLFSLVPTFKYGMGPNEANNNYENFAALPFQVETVKV